MMEAQIKVTGNTCWACRPCLAYAAGITTKMKELEGRLEGVEKRVEDDSREVKGLAKKVESRRSYKEEGRQSGPCCERSRV